MNGRRINSFCISLILACLVTVACKSGQTGSASGMFSAASAKVPVDNPAVSDYAKPYLTDDKMNKLLASMKEDHNPLEFMFKDKGPTNLLTVGTRLEEFNSYARKYGFQDYQDYTAVWGRVTVGQMQIWGAEMMKQTTQGFQKSIADAQADLKKPNLSPEQRKFDEEQIASMQKAIDDMNQSSSKSELNAADMELVKKYKDQIEQAQKKFKAS